MVDQTSVSLKEIMHSVFPALVYGLIGIFLFDLFSLVFTSAGGSGIFTNTTFMSAFGFFVGFGTKLGLVFEKYL
ncbi:MAG: hypothetical protein QXV17_14205 [Candidatus Micrarchaeaceae archaeon]